jgi:hypothetical protein
MAIRKSFYYDPIRQGYDTNSWRTISGAPALVGSRLSVDNSVGIGASAIHYVDFVKGEVTFDVNVPTAPTEGTNREFGMSSPNTSAYILFSLGSTFNCKTSDGTTTTTSSAITWESGWTGANTLFKIRWEAGGAKFFINNVQVYAISDDSVPYGPLSLYLADDSEDSMTIGDIVVKATQSYVLTPKTSDSSAPTTGGKLSISQTVVIAENVSTLIPELMLPFTSGNLFQGVTITENISISEKFPCMVENVTVSENISMLENFPYIADDVTVSENIELYISLPLSYEGTTVSENVDILLPELMMGVDVIAPENITLSDDDGKNDVDLNVVGP